MKTSDKIALSVMMLDAIIFLKSDDTVTEMVFLIFFVAFAITFCGKRDN